MNIHMSKEVDRIRKNYPAGTRVELIKMEDDYSDLTAGDCGTVLFVDDAGQIHVSWDKGSSLALIVEIDEFKKVVS